VSMTQRLDSEHELITASTDGQLLTWDYDVPEPVASVVDEGTEKFTCVRVSPKTGRFLAASNTQQLVKIWDLHTGRVVTVGRAHTSAVHQIAWSPDERQLISVGQDMGIAVWNFYAELVE
jgi:WD40 repeat protein